MHRGMRAGENVVRSAALIDSGTDPVLDVLTSPPPADYALAAAFMACLYSRTLANEVSSVMSATERNEPSSP